ncbi:MAG: radical SAM protein [Muribaculaceae bacterium]|nr:radical SAM protein [Muribaculaceae bacterium]MBR5436119.1 radical SAM protein [Muribaculaceae bacterium]
MRLSKYIQYQHLDDGNYGIINYADSCLVVVCEELYNLFNTYKSAISQLRTIHPDFFNELIACRIVVNKEEDEIDTYIQNKWAKLLINEYIHIIINPTLDCNLRCWYCYERHTKGAFMTKAVAESLLKYLNNRIEETKSAPIHISLFGGEPLIRFATITKPILCEVKKLCDSKGRRIILHITSNGYLITEAIADFLLSITDNITFQIAFDGGQSHHNKTKLTSGGKTTYDRTIENVSLILERGISVVCRVNFTNDNVESIRALLDDILYRGFFNKKHFRVLFEKVWQTKSTPATENLIKEYRMFVNKHGNNVAYLNRSAHHSCYCDYYNTIVVNYDGRVFKCTARDFDEKNSVGRVSDNGQLALDFTPAEYMREMFPYACRMCRAMPACIVCHQIKKERLGNHCPANKTEEEMVKMIQDFSDIILTKFRATSCLTNGV